MERVEVELGERSYPILIGPGLVDEAGARIAGLRPGAACAIVSDSNVERLHGGRLRQSLDAAGVRTETIVVAPGEASKSFATLEDVIDRVLKGRLERSDLIVALGGGVVGDLAGFAAAIARRGMDFVQIPTTLLAQVDSSVGGKTGINTGHGKNLVGAFHQPLLVIADTGLLATLPPREFRAGYAEIVKYGLIDDPDFFAWLENHREAIFALGPELDRAIAASCRAKARIVAADERESGVRALLNLGHTFGHALEGACRYDGRRLVHGEAVAIGMNLAHRFSNRLNLCDSDTAERVERHLKAAGLPTRPADIAGAALGSGELFAFIVQDKKVKRGRLTFILTRGLGKSYIADDVPSDAVQSFLKEILQA